jgi:hypothetical protein
MTMGTGKSLDELAKLLSAYRSESPRSRDAGRAQPGERPF